MDVTGPGHTIHQHDRRGFSISMSSYIIQRELTTFYVYDLPPNFYFKLLKYFTLVTSADHKCLQHLEIALSRIFSEKLEVLSWVPPRHVCPLIHV